jgi:hypothetical protein
VAVVRPALAGPNGGEQLTAGEDVTVSWTVPSGLVPDSYSLYYSADGGVLWQEVATGIVAQTLLVEVPGEATTQGLYRVFASAGGKAIGYDTSDEVFVVLGSSAGVKDGFIPADFALGQNSPNPFRSSTTVQIDLPKDLGVRLEISDVSGRIVRTLVDGPVSAGRYQVVWDGTDNGGHDVAPGVYFLKARAGEFREVKRMVVVK